MPPTHLSTLGEVPHRLASVPKFISEEVEQRLTRSQEAAELLKPMVQGCPVMSPLSVSLLSWQLGSRPSLLATSCALALTSGPHVVVLTEKTEETSWHAARKWWAVWKPDVTFSSLQALLRTYVHFF